MLRDKSSFTIPVTFIIQFRCDGCGLIRIKLCSGIGHIEDVFYIVCLCNVPLFFAEGFCWSILSRSVCTISINLEDENK
ncbi:hypothetical protein Mapa_006398 [Marchantia paleacea]|nr:hypothetical protein Mapa_006398 [Marchantia paleacea]